MCYGVAASQVITYREAVTILILVEAFEGCGFSQLRKTYWKYEEKKSCLNRIFETLIFLDLMHVTVI